MARRDRLKQRDEARERVMQRLSAGPQQEQPQARRRIDRLKDTSQTQLPEVDGVQMMQQSVRSPQLTRPGSAAVGASIATPPPAPSQAAQLPDIGSSVRNWQPPVSDSQRRQTMAEESPMSQFGRSAAKFIADLTPFGSDKPIEPPAKDIGNFLRKTEIPGVTTGPAANFLRGAGDTATFGASTYLDRMMGLPERAEGATQTLPGKIGQFVGPVLPGVAAWKAGGRLLPNIGRMTLFGTGVGAGVEAGQEAFGVNDQTAGQRALDVAITGGASGLLGGAFGLVGKGISKLLQRNKLPEEAVQQILALPSPQKPLGLPEPKVLPPTTARMARPENEYRQKFESLIAEARQLEAQGKFAPGREIEELESLWSLRAGPNDPSLDELINLAYKPRPNRLTPDSLQTARQTQHMRDVAGVPPLVRSQADMYRQGPLAEAAISQRVGRARKDVTPPEALGPVNPPSFSVKGSGREIPTPEFEQAMKQGWFAKLFGNEGVGITPFGSTKAVGRNPVDTAGQIVSSPLRRTTEGTKAEIQAAARAAYQGFADDLKPLKRLGKNIYDRAMDSRRANNVANAIVRDKFVTPQGQVVGEGLENIFRKVARGQDRQFLDYITLRHAKTRMERGERVYSENLGMDVDKVQARIDMYNKRYPGFDKIAKEWDQFNTNMLQVYGVDEGLISKDMFDLLRERNPNYAPMRRQFTTAEKYSLNYGTKPTFSGQKAPIKEVSKTGSVRRIVDPRRSTIEATGAWVNAAMRNRVMQGLVKNIGENPAAFKGIAEIVQPPKGQKNLRELLISEGQEGFLESLDKDFDKLFKRTRLDQDNVVRAMINGQPVYVKVNDPEAAKALIGLGPEQSNLVMDIFKFFSDLTKKGATGALAPMFAVKGLSYDTLQAVVQSKAPAKHLWDLMHATVSSIADKFPAGTPGLEKIRALAQEFNRVGGNYSAVLRGDRELRKGIGRMARDPILSPKNIARTAGKVIASPYRAMEGLADISENVNRMAAYKGGMRGKERTPDNVMNAMNDAREITTNFSRRGSQSQNLEKFIPYNNAAIQGVYRFAKSLKDNPVKTTAMLGVGVFAPKFYEYMNFGDDPDYQIIPARDRYKHLYISKNADGSFVKIPLPHEYGALGALFVDSLRSIKDNDPNAFKGAADAVANAFLPPVLSGAAQGLTQGGGIDQSIPGLFNASVMAPGFALGANQSFTGAPITPQRLQNRSPEFQYDERTSGPAKWIGEKLGIAPTKVDYLIRAYGGDPARLLLPLTSDVGAGTPRNTLLRNFITDPVFTNTLSDDYYSAREKMTQARTDNAQVGAPLPEWYSDDLYKFATSQAQGSPAKMLSDLNAQKREVNGDRTLSAEEKSKRLRELQGQINEIYLEVNTRMQEAGVPLSGR